MNEIHEQNRRSWDAATAAHNSHKPEQGAWLRAGGDTLFPEELELLGDVAGRDLLHLQCNSGQDTLSLARRGARCVGVDISDQAVRTARALSAESGIPARFERADVYDWLARAAERFDVVFASYGALPWLSDLERWARGVAGVLRRGGRLVLVEFHPAAMMLGPDLRPAWPYRSGGRPMHLAEGVDDYVAESGDGLTHGAAWAPGETHFRNPHPAWEFAWGVADVVEAVLGAGLRLQTLREWPHSNGWAPWPRMRREGRRRLPPEGTPELPLMYGLAATRDD